METATVIRIEGSEHDFTAVRVADGRVIAGVWHSDRGEWTVDSVDGPTYRESSRDAAIRRCETLASGLY